MSDKSDWVRLCEQVGALAILQADPATGEAEAAALRVEWERLIRRALADRAARRTAEQIARAA